MTIELHDMQSLLDTVKSLSLNNYRVFVEVKYQPWPRDKSIKCFVVSYFKRTESFKIERDGDELYEDN